MLTIIGAASAYPDTVIDRSALEALGFGAQAQNAESAFGISERRSTLPLDYITSTKNSELKGVLGVATMRSFELGVKAVRAAIETIPAALEQVLLMVGESVTPPEMAPSEAQRVAGALGLKISAYDMWTGGGSIPGHLHLINSWKRERVPALAVSVATTALTQRVNFASEGGVAAIVGDGACAIAITPEEKSGCQVLHTSFDATLQKSRTIELDSLKHLVVHQRTAEQVEREFDELISKIQPDLLDVPLQIVWPGIARDLRERLLEKRKLKVSKIHGDSSLHGYLSVAGHGAWLGDNMAGLKPGERVLLIQAEGGMAWGSALLERVVV